MPPEDRYQHLADPVSPPADSSLERFAAVTKSDSADLAFRTRALILSADGVVKITDRFGTAIPLTLTKGINWVRVDRVWSTGTDAVTVVAAD
jgi:hypothetical protein